MRFLNVMCQEVLRFFYSLNNTCFGLCYNTKFLKGIFKLPLFLSKTKPLKYHSSLTRAKGNCTKVLNCRQSGIAITYKPEYTGIRKVSVAKPACCRLACFIIGIRKGALLKGKINVRKNQFHQVTESNPSNDRETQAGRKDTRGHQGQVESETAGPQAQRLVRKGVKISQGGGEKCEQRLLF